LERYGLDRAALLPEALFSSGDQASQIRGQIPHLVSLELRPRDASLSGRLVHARRVIPHGRGQLQWRGHGLRCAQIGPDGRVLVQGVAAGTPLGFEQLHPGLTSPPVSPKRRKYRGAMTSANSVSSSSGKGTPRRRIVSDMFAEWFQSSPAISEARRCWIAVRRSGPNAVPRPEAPWHSVHFSVTTRRSPRVGSGGTSSTTSRPRTCAAWRTAGVLTHQPTHLPPRLDRRQTRELDQFGS